MSYIVDGIPGNVTIDPDQGEKRQRKREKRAPRRTGDSITISDEARKRSEEGEKEAEEP